MDETDEGKNMFAREEELEIEGETKDEEMVGGLTVLYYSPSRR
jgi:hypothetical protein